ncbi:GNAT family N-acetyltransferase [Nocardia wallacei]|uniref:GNAT family N-acetyltransferase n=1 Tax=Nocardia wallacei TaxID=480035 RepID=UPI0024582A9A|nr:GNAT family N-acetyltransferase [Nocardia wallacei]
MPETFFVAAIRDDIVGRATIRHALNDDLRWRGGHIGYGVLAQHRRCGYGTEILRQSITIARTLGTGRILVTCDDTNAGSGRIFSELASTDCQSSSPC